MDDHLAKPVGSGALRAALAGRLCASAPTATPAEPPVLDAALLGELARSLGSTGPLVEVLTAYRGELPGRVERLRAALATGHSEEVRRVAHELRSPSASFGLARLAAAVRAVEDGGGALATVEAAAAEADAALRAWCAAPVAG